VLEGTPMEPDELIEFSWRERRERVDGQLAHVVKSIRGHHGVRSTSANRLVPGTDAIP
jgi:hypothetical protein